MPALHSGTAKKSASEHLQGCCSDKSILNAHLQLQRGSTNQVRDAFLSSSILTNCRKTSEGNHEDAGYGRQGNEEEEEEKRRGFKDGGNAEQVFLETWIFTNVLPFRIHVEEVQFGIAFLR